MIHFVRPYVSLERISKHYKNFTFAYIVNRAYLSYYIQCNVLAIMIKIIINIIIVLFFGFLTFHFGTFLFLFVCTKEKGQSKHA